MPGRNSQVSRIYCALDLLEGATQGLTVVELTRELNDRGHEVGRRTVYRDLEAMAAAGFPVFQKESESAEIGAKWILEKTVRINQYLALSPRELVALWMARGISRSLASAPFYKDLEKAFSKIEEKIGSRGKEFFQELAEEIRFEQAQPWGNGVPSELVETLQSSCAEGQVVEAKYRSTRSKSVTKRRIGPHYLYFAKGSLYLIGEDLADQKVKLFSVARLSEARMLDERYQVKVQPPEELFGQSFGVFRGEKVEGVELEFSEEVALYVSERKWHPSQKLIESKEGRVILKLKIAIAPDFVQWVMSFGSQVRVAEPASLRARIVEQAQEILKNYHPNNLKAA